jgi:hypothetical protein
MVAVSLQSLHDTVTKTSANLFVERDFSGNGLLFRSLLAWLWRARLGSKIGKNTKLIGENALCLTLASHLMARGSHR